jgi:hypothetical protein
MTKNSTPDISQRDSMIFMNDCFKRSAGLVYGLDLHHLDHVAAICHLLDIPLIVTEEQVSSLAQIYYPDLSVSLIHYSDLGYQVVQNFDWIYSSLPRLLLFSN